MESDHSRKIVDLFVPVTMDIKFISGNYVHSTIFDMNEDQLSWLLNND